MLFRSPTGKRLAVILDTLIITQRERAHLEKLGLVERAAPEVIKLVDSLMDEIKGLRTILGMEVFW